MPVTQSQQNPRCRALRAYVGPRNVICYDPGPPNFHFPPAPIPAATTPPAPVKPPSAPAPVRPSTPPRVPTPPHETTYQRQLQDTWEEGYDTVMKSPSHTSARAPSPPRTVHMRSPTPPTPTHMILPMPRRRKPSNQQEVTPPPDSPPISPTAQFLSDWKNYLPEIREQRRKYVVTEDTKDPRHRYYTHSQMQQAKHHYDGTVRILPADEPSK